MSEARPARVRFFADRQELRAWFEAHHDTVQEVWIGYWRKGVGRSGVTYLEAVQEALCFGWVDSQVRSLDSVSYANRYTPRRGGSRWSPSNAAIARALVRAGRMRAPGLQAFRGRARARRNSPRRAGSGKG